MPFNWSAFKRLGLLAAIAVACPAWAAYDETALPGQIVVHPQTPRWLSYAGGGPFFLCGPGDPEGFLYRGQRNADGTRSGDQLALIEKLKGSGANSIYLMAVRSHGGDGGSSENPFVESDPARGLDDDILNQWETWFAAMDEAGIVVYFFFYDDSARIWNTGDVVGSAERDFIRGLVDRFEHHRHLIWVVAEEYSEKYTPARVKAIAAEIRQTDDHGHVIAVHKSSGLTFDEFADDPNLDQFAIQYNPSSVTPDALHSGMVTAWQNAAGRYNLNMTEVAYGKFGTGVTARKNMWAVALGGAYVMINGMDIVNTALSDLEDCGRLNRFMLQTEFPTMAPHDELRAGGAEYVLANPGTSYILYGASAATLGVSTISPGTYDLLWFSPSTGASVTQSNVTVTGGSQTWAPPAGFGGEVALYLKRQMGVTPPPSCTESWTCTAWSACVNNIQTRTCTDSNHCGTTTRKPAETQSCTDTPPSGTLTFTPQPGSPMAKREHPRLHITNSHIPELKNSIAQYYKNEYQAYVNWAWQTGDDAAKVNSLSASGHDVLKPLMIHQAFIGALGTVSGITYPAQPSEFSRRAINRMKKSLDGGDSLSVAAALVYDWTYNTMTPAERQDVTSKMATRTIVHNSGSDTLSAPRETPFGAMMSSDYMESMYAWYLGLALWGDGYLDDAADKAVKTFYTMMLNYGYLDAQNFIADDDGGFAEWIGYSSWHPKTHFLFVDGWTTATGENFIHERQGSISGNAIKTFPQFAFYAVDPHLYQTPGGNKYSFISMGGGQTTDSSFGHQEMKEYLLFLPGILNRAGLSSEAGLMSYFLQTYQIPWPSYHTQEFTAFAGVPKSITPVTPESLHLPKSMWSKNLGLFIAKTGFVKNSEGAFFVSDSHFRFVLSDSDGFGGRGTQGFPGFGLTKFGPLVGSRNVAHRGYGNLEDYDGAHQHNVVYFHDGAAKEAYLLSSGRKNIDESPAALQGAVNREDKYEWGGIEQVTRKNNELYHLRVDRSRSFTSGVGHTREYVWLPGANPDTDSDFLVVYDRTKAPASAQPHWVYHVPWQPDVLDFSSQQDITTGAGLTDRKGAAYVGTGLIVKELNHKGDEGDYRACSSCSVQNYVGGAGARGVMFSKTLLPAQAKVEVTRVAALDGDVLNRQGELAIKAHRWQVDVAPQQTTGDDRFLHAMQTALNTVPAMAKTSLIDAGETQGLFIERERTDRPNYVVLFSKNADAVATPIAYSVSGAGWVQHTISGLKPRTHYDIVVGSTTLKTHATETDVELWDYKGLAQNIETGVLYFDTTLAGTQTITVKESGVGGVRGDVNQDGVLNLRDAIQLLRWIAGQPGRPEPGTDRFITADINRDGRLTLADFINLLKTLFG